MYMNQIKQTIPKLSNTTKGQLGRIAILGGSVEYTGAPYFSGISSLRTGSDLCHIITPTLAAQVIKSYSPELMVHPMNFSDSTDIEKIYHLLERIDCLVIGPGLGRNPDTIKTVVEVIKKCKEIELPLIIDADGIFVIQNDLNVIRGYPKLIITPNVNEFERIKLALNIHIKDRKESVLKSSDLLGCVIFSKGQTDLIASRGVVVEVDQDGSPRRCGGQGDILTGCIATFLAWGLKNDVDMDLYLNACYAGSVLVRRASKEAFAVHYRSMIASDIIQFISKAFNEKFETE